MGIEGAIVDSELFTRMILSAVLENGLTIPLEYRNADFTTLKG